MNKKVVLVAALLLCVLFAGSAVADQTGWIVLFSGGRAVEVSEVNGLVNMVPMDVYVTENPYWGQDLYYVYNNLLNGILMTLKELEEMYINSGSQQNCWYTPDGHYRKTNMDYVYYDQPVAIEDGVVVFLD